MKGLGDLVKENWMAALLGAVAVALIVLFGAPKGTLQIADKLTDEDLTSAVCGEEQPQKESVEPTTE